MDSRGAVRIILVMEHHAASSVSPGYLSLDDRAMRRDAVCMASPFDPFRRRRITCDGVRIIGGSSLKCYSVDVGNVPHDRGRFATTEALVAAAVPEVDDAAGRPGAGFLIKHQGATGDYLVAGWWSQQNELPMRVWVRADGTWRPAGPHESFCVWDLEIVWFERNAWVETMLTGQNVEHGLAAYLARTFEVPTDAPDVRPAPQKPYIPMTVAEQVDLRVGTITGIAPVERSDKLMRLTVDFGADVRTVVAGIRQERAHPESLVGRQALFYYNLEPRTMRGVTSEAMLCDAGYADGIRPALLQPEWPLPNGTRAG